MYSSISFISASNMDFVEGPYVLPIFAGTEINCIQITILEDDISEGDEAFVVSAEAQGPEASRIFLSPGSVLVIIEDNGKRELNLMCA